MKEKFCYSGLLILASLLSATLVQAGDNHQELVAAIKVNAARDFVASHEDAVIMDVRTPIEYKHSHIAGAVNVSVQDASFENMVNGLDPNKTYIVHCTRNPAEGRSSRVLETLKNLGFKNLYSLEGGYVAWKDAELPLTETSD